MVNYLLEVLMMVSVGLILYLFARALPRVNDADLDAKPQPGLPHWVHGYLEKLDEWLLATIEKTIRRIRLWILKVDNSLSEKLKRFKRDATKETGFPTIDAPKNGNGNGHGDAV
jgi:hypothetical protein